MITEDHPYIAARLKLLAAVAEHGIGTLLLNDAEAARDKTTYMVATWKATRAEEARLRTETLRCVAITPRGKIDVHDPETLEALNARISRLVEVREAIERAVTSLHEQAPGYLRLLEAGKAAAERDIVSVPHRLNFALGTELKDFHAPDVEAAMKSHRYQQEKERCDATTQNAKARLAELEPQIALIREQLAAVEAILGAPLKAEPMSGQGGYASAITREKAAGLV
jgi:hypothetical protein